MGIRKLIAKHIGYPLQDKIKGTKILRTLDFLSESQFWDDQKIKNYQIEKLKRLIAHSYQNVPYYQNLFDSISLKPSDINSLEDIKKIPILTKEIARANQDKLTAARTSTKHIKKGKTGGTTGVPLIVFSDIDNRSFAWASYHRWYNWIGIAKEDRALSLWGAKTVLKSSFKANIIGKTVNWLQNNKRINAFNINEGNIHEVYSQIIKYDPVIIRGYLSAMILIAKYMQKNNLPPNKSLKALSSTSETLLPMYRKFLQEVFTVPIFDQYGCGEVSSISYECSKHQGLHINEEHVFVEFLDENNTEVVNKKGRLIVTSLDNYVMPFIRFETGDMATLNAEKCTCGLNSPLMSSIEGRTIDTVTLTNGSKVHGVFFTDLLHEVGITTDTISRFQIYQYKSGAIDFKLETKNNLSKEILSKLELETLRFVKDVRIILVDEIPNEPNGKFKYIKNETDIF